MRGLMICASVALASWQVWTFIPMHRSASTTERVAETIAYAPVAQDTPKLVQAVAMAPTKTLMAKTRSSDGRGMESCYQHYRRIHAGCADGDQACEMQVADRLDLCEATGFWD